MSSPGRDALCACTAAIGSGSTAATARSRYYTKPDLTARALLDRAGSSRPSVEVDGSSPAGLERFLAATFSAAERATPLLRSAMAEAQRDPRAAEGMRQFTAARREELCQVLVAAQRRGGLSRDADLDLLIDQVYGLLWYRILIGHAPLTADVAARLARTLGG